MKDLIERLETASQGSRELDAEIERKVSGVKVWLASKNDPFDYDEETEAWMDWAGETVKVPHYTMNLQTALTLLPEGWTWVMSGGEDRATVHLIAPLPDNHWETRRTLYEVAATPALSFVKVCLQARSQYVRS